MASAKKTKIAKVVSLQEAPGSPGLVFFTCVLPSKTSLSFEFSLLVREEARKFGRVQLQGKHQPLIPIICNSCVWLVF